PVPVNTLDLSFENHFLELLNAEFTFLLFTKSDLQKDYEAFNPVSIYSTNYALLKSKLTRIEFTIDNLESFLTENKRRSLLYFNAVDFLVDNFKKWIKQNAERNKPIDEEEDLEEFLSEFSYQTGSDIEEVSTNEVESLTSTNGGSGGGSG